jgi:uncharacterized protein (DUF924 family)
LADDLVVEGVEVHAKAAEVLGFWFDLVMPEQWFAGSASMDEEIATLFGPLRELVLRSEALGWRDEPDTLLAAVILLDQFSRNIHRGTAEAFAADPLARELSLLAMERGWDQDMAVERRQFLYMPLMHAEDPELQGLCVERFEALGDERSLAYAREHAAAIARFGRFPTRNAALGRESTAEEREYLRQGVDW